MNLTGISAGDKVKFDERWAWWVTELRLHAGEPSALLERNYIFLDYVRQVPRSDQKWITQSDLDSGRVEAVSNE